MSLGDMHRAARPAVPERTSSRPPWCGTGVSPVSGRHGGRPLRRHTGVLRHTTHGFTLIELMVVVVILILLVSVSVPAVGPMLASNQEAQVLNTLNGILTTAQSQAIAKGTEVGVRFERAIRTNDAGLILDTNGKNSSQTGYDVDKPALLDYQRVRIVDFAQFKDVAFRHNSETKVYDLPPGTWVAPGECLEWPSPGLVEAKLIKDPAEDSERAVKFNRIETFYVVFDQEGELTRFPPAYNTYADLTQQYLQSDVWVVPYVNHSDKSDPDSQRGYSARSLLVYDRQQWLNQPDTHAARLAFMQSQARPVYISRATGAILGGKK